MDKKSRLRIQTLNYRHSTLESDMRTLKADTIDFLRELIAKNSCYDGDKLGLGDSKPYVKLMFNRLVMVKVNETEIEKDVSYLYLNGKDVMLGCMELCGYGNLVSVPTNLNIKNVSVFDINKILNEIIC